MPLGKLNYRNTIQKDISDSGKGENNEEKKCIANCFNG